MSVPGFRVWGLGFRALSLWGFLRRELFGQLISKVCHPELVLTTMLLSTGLGIASQKLLYRWLKGLLDSVGLCGGFYRDLGATDF